MKKTLTLCLALLLLLSSIPALASSSHKGDGMQMDMGAGKFKHMTVVDGLRSEFEIMSLDKMNMKDPNGATHHVMVKLFDDKSNTEIKKAVGKIKVIAPNGVEQVGQLKNYHGIFAANISFPEKGKYGIICLLKIDGQKHLVKFWYPHQG